MPFCDITKTLKIHKLSENKSLESAWIKMTHLDKTKGKTQIPSIGNEIGDITVVSEWGSLPVGWGTQMWATIRWRPVAWAVRGLS